MLTAERHRSARGRFSVRSAQKRSCASAATRTSPMRMSSGVFGPASCGSGSGIDLVFRIINTQVRTMDELGLTRASEIAHALSEWAHPRHRLGRQRQIDHAGGAGRADEPGAARAHHHAGRSDRIHLRAEGLPHHPARSAHAYALVRRGVARIAPRRSGCDHGRRNARSGDDLARHHRLRDRTPGPGNAAHRQCLAHARSLARCLSGRSTGTDPRSW